MINAIRRILSMVLIAFVFALLFLWALSGSCIAQDLYMDEDGDLEYMYETYNGNYINEDGELLIRKEGLGDMDMFLTEDGYEYKWRIGND